MISICPYVGTLKNLAQVLLSLFYSCGNWDREGQWPRSDKYALIWHQSPSSLPQKLNVCYHMPNGKDYAPIHVMGMLKVHEISCENHDSLISLVFDYREENHISSGIFFFKQELSCIALENDPCSLYYCYPRV